MARYKLVHDRKGAGELLSNNPGLERMLMDLADEVKVEMISTAQNAQNGPGNTLSGYAEAGFQTEWQARGRRSRVIVKSLADPILALRVHFYTQKRDGVAHMRAAMRKKAS